MPDYQWKVDVVVELPDGADPDAFFTAIWDAVLDVADMRGARMGGAYDWQEYEEEEGEG